MFTCSDCPENAVCDGINIISCPANYTFNGIGCGLSYIADCNHGQSLMYCICRTNRVYAGSSQDGLLCDVNKNQDKI